MSFAQKAVGDDTRSHDNDDGNDHGATDGDVARGWSGGDKTEQDGVDDGEVVLFDTQKRVKQVVHEDGDHGATDGVDDGLSSDSTGIVSLTGVDAEPQEPNDEGVEEEVVRIRWSTSFTLWCTLPVQEEVSSQDSDGGQHVDHNSTREIDDFVVSEET